VRFPAAEDRPVANALRALPGVGAAAAGGRRARELFARAELHGVAGVIWDAWKSAEVPIDRELETTLEAGAIARELDYAGHVALLHQVDVALTVPAVALKGPLFAERYYQRPSARGTSDVDLLVSEEDLDRAIESLGPLGYTVLDSSQQIAWSRREHHHLHLTRPGCPDLELHFHAYRGFGVTLRTGALAHGSLPARSFERLRVAAPEDELVYLAVHAASHRFGRLSWLYDLRLVVERMSPDAIRIAAQNARAWGVSRVVALAAELLVETLGVAQEVVAPLGTLPRARRAFVRAMVAEPRARLLGSASRFAYTTMLADSVAASLRYAKAASFDHARRLLGGR
jgi:hypothetical protein